MATGAPIGLKTICIFLLVSSLLATGCREKAAVQTPAVQPSPDPAIGEFILKGDEFFAHENLYGWRMAEGFYDKADALGGDPGLKEKLLLTRVLLVTRQIDEDIEISALKKRLASSCASVVDPTSRSLCGFADKYLAPRDAPNTNSDPSASAKIPVFAPAEDTLDTYFRILYAQAAAINLPDGFELSAWEKYKSSPLFMYLNLRKVAAQPTEEVEKTFSDFTELYVLNGEKRLQAGRYRESRTYFNKALDLVPDYTRAINGLGNIHNSSSISRANPKSMTPSLPSPMKKKLPGWKSE
jgi:tetratricopeptide (TPR) repeat protein